MNHLRQSTIILSFVLSAFIFVGCGISTAERKFDGDANKPLAVPQTVAGKPKIVAFGDSLTAGFGLTEKESYPYLLQEKLKSEGYEYEVINAGVSGDTSIGGLERADWVLGQENVQILILELGANDLLRRMPVDKMKRNLAQIIEKAQAKNVKVLLCGMLAPTSVGADYQREYVNTFSDLADKYKVEFLPFLLENVALNKNLNQADGIHPNAEGARIMTENIHKELKPMLTK
ncbi:MAG: arylesterase [Acidobacteriota bacterium]|nr:arylesterase [Acidobacteriota bacterium]